MFEEIRYTECHILARAEPHYTTHSYLDMLVSCYQWHTATSASASGYGCKRRLLAVLLDKVVAEGDYNNTTDYLLAVAYVYE